MVGGDVSGEIYLWEIATGKLMKKWHSHYRAVTCLVFSDDQSLVISGSEEGSVRVWSLFMIFDDRRREEAKHLYEYSFSEHTLKVTDIVTGYGGCNAIIVSSSEDRTCKDAIFRVVAAVLHLGNIEFAKGDETDSSEPKDYQSWYHLKTAAELLMCDEKALEDSLCKHVIVTRDEAIMKCLDPTAAAINRDALAKIVYSRLFDWLVNKINNSIGQDPDSRFLIGVLDIYEFESFKTNRYSTCVFGEVFAQMMITYERVTRRLMYYFSS